MGLSCFPFLAFCVHAGIANASKLTHVMSISLFLIISSIEALDGQDSAEVTCAVASNSEIRMAGMEESGEFVPDFLISTSDSACR